MTVTARVPNKITIILTRRCNQRCEFCFDASNILCPGAVSHMSLDTVDRIIDTLRVSTDDPSSFNVTLSGGEPTLHPQFLEVLQRISTAGFTITILTNGQRFASRRFMAEVLRYNIWNLQFSIEGASPEVHDRRVGCRGAWERLVRAIENARAFGVRFITNTTMTHTSVQDMFPVIDFLNELGVPKMNIGNTLPECAGRNRKVMMEYPEVVEIAERLTLYALSKRIPFSFITPLPLCLKAGRVISNPSVCSAGRYSMIIDVDGTFRPCSVSNPPGQSLPRVEAGLPHAQVCDQLDVVVSEYVRSDVPIECRRCSQLSECRACCPLYWKVPGVRRPSQWFAGRQRQRGLGTAD